jgi:hypothetical protein
MSAYEVYKELLHKAEVYYFAHVDEIKAEKKKPLAARYYLKNKEQIKAKVKAYKALKSGASS